MATVTFDADRWQIFCQLIDTSSYQTLDQLLGSFLARLIEFWPAKSGALLYVNPDGVQRTCTHGEPSDNGYRSIEEARTGFTRLTAIEQDLGIFGIDDDEVLIELPLRSGTDSVGLLHLLVAPHRVSPEGNDELALVMVGALGRTADHMSLLQRTEQELAELALLSHVSQSITSNLDLRSLLRAIVEQTSKALDAEGGSLLLVDEQRRELYFELPTGERKDELTSYRMPMDKGLAGWVATHGKGLIVNDAQHDPRFYRQVDQDISFETRSVLSVPVSSRERTIGVIQVVNKRHGGFTDRDMRLLTTLANQAAIAIENAQLYANLKEERDRLIHKEEEVRHRINRDLHDGPAQAVSAIAMNIEFIKKLLHAMPEKVEEELDVLASLVKKTNHDIRTLLFELRPLGLETQGLVATLQQYVERFRDPRGIRLHLDAGNFDRRLSHEAEAVSFIIIQEAVNNARKHAGSQDIWIGLSEEDNTLVARIQDKGKGFDLRTVEGAYDQRGSFGLLNMRERARLIGGNCTIQSTPEKGTTIELRVPIPSEASEPLETLISG